MIKALLTCGHDYALRPVAPIPMQRAYHVQAERKSHATQLTYLTLTMCPSHPTPPPNHRFDDDDDDFDPDRLAHYDALACGIVSVQRARLMP